MTDMDGRLSLRYRELAREEPPAPVDAAILAAARDAARKPAYTRWAGPVSIAAVLVLGIGISLRMQLEQPGIETSVPAPAASAEYPVPQASPAEPEAPKALAKPEAAANVEGSAERPMAVEATKPAPATKAQPEPRRAERQAPEPATTASVAAAPPPAAPPAAAMPLPAAPPAEAPPAARTATDRASFGAQALRSEPPAEARAKRAAEATPVQNLPALRDAREAELERIAKLRTEGRHEEADKALAEFRKQHPDYRIPEAMWERVKPR